MYYGLLRLGFTPADFELRDDSDGKGVYIEFWHSDKPQPSASEIQTAQDAYEAEYKTNKYQRDRAVDYPSIQDQLDDLYHNGIDGWKATIKTTKDKFPKE